MTLPRAAFAALALFLAPATAHADPLGDAVKGDMPSLLALYRGLHQHPELSFKEVKTAALLAKEMKALGFSVTTGVGGTGIVAVLENGPGKTIMLRTDMDALPVTEQTGLPYASLEKGVMHACGHDIHMTSWIGAARRLVARKTDWTGTLVMIAQPAEELGEGARAMLDDGLFTRFPKPSAAIALHDSAAMPAGTIGYAPGYTFANVDSLDIVVKGVGGHGAYPQNTKDPVVVAARIVTSLQTIVSREVDPQDAAVVTVGHIFGGTKRNVIPDEVTLELTIRSYSDATRRKLLDSIARIAKAEAMAAGMPDDRLPEIRAADSFTPAAFNTEPLTGRIIGLFRTRFGDRVMQMAPTMGGEDFGRYRTGGAEPIQSLIFWLGAVPQGKWDAAKGDIASLPSLHSALWAPDPEPAIATGVEALTAAALDLLKRE
ncbi:MAG: amidohydrolase [Sphingobium sp.]